MMIEKEIKKLCNREEFLRYKSLLKKISTPYIQETDIQINYYYDTPDYILNKKQDTLRVRQKGNTLKLQYKNDKQRDNNTCINQEFERDLEKLPLIILPQLLPQTNSGSNHEYHLIGVLTTERCNYYYKSVVISFDTNYYLGICDYELEIEYEDFNDATEILALLNINDVDIHFYGKYSRFIETLNRRNVL